MNTSITLIGVVLIITLALQLGFLLNAQVLYGMYLTCLGLILGACITVALAVLKTYRNRQSMYILEENPHKARWYKRVFQTELVALVCIGLSMLVVSLANNQLAVFEPYEETFVVAGKNERFFRSNSYQYLELDNGATRVKYLTDREIPLGTDVTVTLRRGLLGFPVLLEVGQAGSEACSTCDT